ncbi:uncharacterized protein BO97DRAFT_346516, partial [Aspergillus homomorphus CBS 101889]
KARRAVVTDFELGMVMDESRGRAFNGLAFLGAVDFLTGEVLIREYVKPTGKVTNWNSCVSGIKPADMNAAVRRGAAIHGCETARAALWGYVHSDTVITDQALQNDLDALGIIHPRVVDTAIVTTQTAFKGGGQSGRFCRTWGLRILASDLLCRNIQKEEEGHNAAEDALATKDLLLCCIENPTLLDDWARAERGAYPRYEPDSGEDNDPENEGPSTWP